LVAKNRNASNKIGTVRRAVLKSNKMDKLEKYYRQEFMKYPHIPDFDTLLEGEKKEIENSLGFALWALNEAMKDIFEKVKNLLK